MKNASNKRENSECTVYAPRRLQKFPTLEKDKILACSMIESQFAYCLLIWIFCSKTDIQRVEKVQYKNLQVVYNDYMTTHDEVLTLGNKLKILFKLIKFQRGSKFSNYKIELRNQVTLNDATLGVTNSKAFIKILLSIK